MRCYRCMKEYSAEQEACPHCGYVASLANTTAYQLPPGTILAGRYWIGIVLGKGGFGITYKAYDLKLHIVVAVKEYYPIGLVKREDDQVRSTNQDRDEEFQLGLHRFLEEARNLARFSKHPNIVDVFHFFKENGTGYIVMEHLDGISMKYFLKVNEGKMSVFYAKEIVLAIADALATLHASGILHRDVSPDNIFLCSDGKIKLIDFGASRLSAKDEDCREVIVKPGYAPPEQYHKDSVQGPWTDIYALGATFYCAVTGCVPIEATQRLQEDLLVSPGNWDTEIPMYIDHIIRKAMALKPKERFASAKEMAEALTAGKMVTVPKTQKERKVQRRRMIRVSVCIGLLCLICITGIAAIQSVTPRGSLTVWLCAGKDADVTQLQEDYNALCEQWTAQRYPKLHITVHVEPEQDYLEHLVQALQTDHAPDVFESTDMEDATYPYSEALTDLADRFNQRDSYYFLSRYASYFPKQRQLPIGFDVEVLYVLQGEEDLGASMTLPDSIEKAYVYDGSGEQLQQFLTGQIPYLVGHASDYESVSAAYAESVRQTSGGQHAVGLLKVYPVQGAEVTYRTMSVWTGSSHKQKKLAELYLAYLLSYEGQQHMSEEEQMLSVNCRLDGEDREKVRKKLTVLESQLEEYR